MGGEMKRKGILFFAVLLAFMLSASIALAAGAPQGALPVDAGNYNDYSGGSDWSSGSDWSGSDWDSDYSSSSGGFFIGGGSSWVWLIVLIIISIAISTTKSKTRRRGRAPHAAQQAMPQITDHTPEIERAILAVDPLFNKDTFLAWSKEVYVTLQQAWMKRDWAKIRPFEKEELFAQHQKLLQEYIEQGRINVMERINVNQAFLQKYERDPQYEYLTVYMQVRIRDYIIDEKTKKVLMGDPNNDCYMKYLLKFTRKNGVKTDPASAGKNIVACPHCGAPTQITSAGKCEYCGFIVTTGDYDWVLCDMQSVKPGVIVDDRGVVIRRNGESFSGGQG